MDNDLAALRAENLRLREALRNRLVEAADNAGAFDSGEAVVSIDDAITAALPILAKHGGAEG